MALGQLDEYRGIVQIRGGRRKAEGGRRKAEGGRRKAEGGNSFRANIDNINSFSLPSVPYRPMPYALCLMPYALCLI